MIYHCKSSSSLKVQYIWREAGTQGNIILYEQNTKVSARCLFLKRIIIKKLGE